MVRRGVAVPACQSARLGMPGRWIREAPRPCTDYSASKCVAYDFLARGQGLAAAPVECRGRSSRVLSCSVTAISHGPGVHGTGQLASLQTSNLSRGKMQKTFSARHLLSRLRLPSARLRASGSRRSCDFFSCARLITAPLATPSA